MEREENNYSYLLESAIHSISRILAFTNSEGFLNCETEDVEVRMEALMKAWEQIKRNEEMLVKTRDVLVLADTERKVAEAEEFYFKARAALKKKTIQLVPIIQEREAQPIAVQVNMPFQQNDVRNTWGEFDGNLTKFQGFHDRFVAAIHENDRISPAYKFSYLKNSLTGKAARTLGEWQLSDQNYNEAWQRLNEIFNKKYATCRELLRQFFKLPVLQGIPKANELQRMSNTTHETLRQLAAQGIPTEQWDMIVVHILHEKLDSETACKWEETRTSEKPTAKEICTFLERRAMALQSAHDNRRKEPSTSGTYDNVAPSYIKTEKRNLSVGKKRMPCHSCGSMDHPIWNCSEFKVLNLKARQDHVKELNLCANCLKIGHAVNNCYQGPCVRCPGRQMHNSMLCPIKEFKKVEATVFHIRDGRKRTQMETVRKIQGKKEAIAGKTDGAEGGLLDETASGSKSSWDDFKRKKRTRNNNNNNKDKNVTFYSNCLNVDRVERLILLPTMQVRIEIDGKQYGPIRALLDTGAQPNLVSYQLQKRLSLPKEQMITPWFTSANSLEEEFWVLPTESQWRPIIPAHDLESIHEDETTELPLADPEYWKAGPVDLLFGCKILAETIVSIIGRESHGTLGMETTFGKVILGEHEQRISAYENQQVSQIVLISNDQLHESLKRLWQLDEFELDHHRTKEQELVEENFVNTYARDASGRFVVTIPLKEPGKVIGSSELIAKRRFFALERRLERDPELRQKYIEFMREYEGAGHMRPVTGSTETKMVYHIPHHCVTKKFRVVFDASCKTIKGISLNDVQMLGEKLQRNLQEIVMRFRRHRIAISADIRMMFRMVRIVEHQWDLQRIFWRESSKERLKEYWLTVVTYGMTSSAYNAVRAVIQCAKDAEEDFQNAAKAIKEDFYMDDCATGADTERGAIELSKDIDHILRGAGFELRKWKSNSKRLVKEMNSEEQSVMLFQDEGNSSILGLKWLIDRDQFTFEVKTLMDEERMTKRKIVSCIAQLYDPNGFISPITICGKILIQDIWRLNIEWDERLPEEIEERWNGFWKEIRYLEQFQIDRWIGTYMDARKELHGFSDASGKAYGAVIYVRIEHPNGKIIVNLLTAKTRVAPLKTVTIPRLELAAAELLGRLLTSVIRSMEWEGIEYNLWTDSLVTLHWINKLPCYLKTFVANRVSSIQTNTEIKRWRHISTKENPADILSRGTKPSNLINNKLWMHGPEWLMDPRSNWPSERLETNISDVGRDEMRVFMLMKFEEPLSIYVERSGESVLLIDYVHTLEKAINIISYVFRFINAIKMKLCEERPRKRQRKSLRQRNKRENLFDQPTSEEKLRAVDYLLQKEQERYFGREIASIRKNKCFPEKSKIESLKPMIDGKNILRVGGRLERAEIEYERKHPAIVPSGSRLAWLVMDSAHRATKHGAVQVMIQYIRQKFWIPRIRNDLRNFLHKCVVCVRYNHRFETQLMSDLPRERVNPGKAFLHSGVDYAGPFQIKMIDRDGEQIIRQKCWVSIFVCLKTRAVHIDLVSNLTSVAFIACFERFIARRGRCERLFSDNGTAFIGAAKELQRAKEIWLGKETLEHLNMKGTEWKFMTPAAPHQGGIYEAAVKSMKYHLTRIVGPKVLAYEQFLTLLTGIEAILNSRPLHPLNDDPSDLQVLTPGHFLVGEPLVLPLPFATNELSNTQGVRLWKERKTMLQHFWVRWREEYLSTLFERKKWRREKHELKEGQLVIIKRENFPPSAWALGRISRLIASKDGLVRNVVIQTATNQLTRPVQKICVLPIEN